VSVEPRPNENASKKMETEKVITANEKNHLYSQIRKTDKKKVHLIIHVFIQLMRDQIKKGAARMN
jgi:hypothetical protein